MSTNPFDQVQKGINAFLQSKGLQNLENPISNLIKQGLQDMEFVSLEDFETQRQILERLRAKVKSLEARLEEMEKKS